MVSTKLAIIGLSSKMLHMLQSIYRNAKSMVHCNNSRSYSKLFPQSKSIHQGCNLSPLLFSLFMNDLESYLNCNPSGSCQLNNHRLRLLMFADDIILLTDTETGPQNSTKRLEEFCNGWELSINIKLLVFTCL